jgi:putative acetyltransferase
VRVHPCAVITLRFARSEDVPAIVAVVREVLAEFGLTFGEGAATDEELLRLPASYEDAGGAFWVACDGDLVVGTCGVFPVAPKTVELRKMYLERAARRTGLGQRLLDTSIAWSRERGHTAMVLDTTDKMERAIAFYEANGFARDDRQIRGARCSRGYRRAL